MKCKKDINQASIERDIFRLFDNIKILVVLAYTIIISAYEISYYKENETLTVAMIRVELSEVFNKAFFLFIILWEY